MGELAVISWWLEVSDLCEGGVGSKHHEHPHCSASVRLIWFKHGCLEEADVNCSYEDDGAIQWSAVGIFRGWMHLKRRLCVTTAACWNIISTVILLTWRWTILWCHGAHGLLIFLCLGTRWRSHNIQFLKNCFMSWEYFLIFDVTYYCYEMVRYGSRN